MEPHDDIASHSLYAASVNDGDNEAPAPNPAKLEQPEQDATSSSTNNPSSPGNISRNGKRPLLVYFVPGLSKSNSFRYHTFTPYAPRNAPVVYRTFPGNPAHLVASDEARIAALRGTLSGLAKMLLDSVKKELALVHPTEYASVAFVCRDFGGIIAKRAMVLANTFLKDSHWLVVQNTVWMGFYGTPHASLQSSGLPLKRALRNIIDNCYAGTIGCWMPELIDKLFTICPRMEVDFRLATAAIPAIVTFYQDYRTKPPGSRIVMPEAPAVSDMLELYASVATIGLPTSFRGLIFPSLPAPVAAFVRNNVANACYWHDNSLQAFFRQSLNVMSSPTRHTLFPHAVFTKWICSKPEFESWVLGTSSKLLEMHMSNLQLNHGALLESILLTIQPILCSAIRSRPLGAIMAPASWLPESVTEARLLASILEQLLRCRPRQFRRISGASRDEVIQAVRGCRDSALAVALWNCIRQFVMSSTDLSIFVLVHVPEDSLSSEPTRRVLANIVKLLESSKGLKILILKTGVSGSQDMKEGSILKVDTMDLPCAKALGAAVENLLETIPFRPLEPKRPTYGSLFPLPGTSTSWDLTALHMFIHHARSLPQLEMERIITDDWPEFSMPDQGARCVLNHVAHSIRDIFRWALAFLCFSFRPLRTLEMKQLVAAALSDQKVKPEDVNVHMVVPFGDLCRLSSVRLAYDGLRDVLYPPSRDVTQDNPWYVLDENPHSAMCRLCLQVIRDRESESSTSGSEVVYDAEEYALRHWFSHYKLCDPKPPLDEFWVPIDKLGGYNLLAQRVYMSDVAKTLDYHCTVELIYHGHRLAVDNGGDIRRGVIVASAQRGELDVLGHFLAAKPELFDESLIANACRQSSEGALELLSRSPVVENGAPLLTAAAKWGYTGLIPRLLDVFHGGGRPSGEDKSLASDDLCGAVAAAAEFSGLDTVLLLVRTVELTDWSKIFSLVSSHVCLHGNSSRLGRVVELFLEHGMPPDVMNEADAEGRTPLFRAIISGFTDVATLLLSHGVDSKATGGATALHTACYYGRLEMVPILTEAGVSVYSIDQDGALPLQLALDNGFEETALAILDHYHEDGFSHNEDEDVAPSPTFLRGDGTPQDVHQTLEDGTDFLARITLEPADYGGNEIIPEPISNEGGRADLGETLGSELGVQAEAGQPEDRAASHGPLDISILLKSFSAAVRLGSITILKKIIALGFDPRTASLHEAPSPETLQFLLGVTNRETIDAICVESIGVFRDLSALQWFSIQGDLEMVKVLLTNGAAIETPIDGKFSSALQVAAMSQQTEMVTFLAERCSPQVKYRALLAVCLRGLNDMVELLLDNGCPIHLGKINTPVALACCQGQIRTVQILLMRGANPWFRAFFIPEGHELPITVALRTGSVECVKLLMARCPERTSLTWAGDLAHVAAENDQYQALVALLESGYSSVWSFGSMPNKLLPGITGEQPYSQRCLELLVRHFLARPRTKFMAVDALWTAVDKGKYETAKWLVRWGVDPNCDRVVEALLSRRRRLRVESGGLLYHLASNFKIDAVRFLLEELGVPLNVNMVGGIAGTALQVALRKGPAEGLGLCKLLLDHGADPTIKAGVMGSPLNEAVSEDNMDGINLLLSREGVSKDMADTQGRLPIHLAPTIEIHDLMTTEISTAESTDGRGRNALHFAASGGLDTLELVKHILDKYPNLVNSRDCNDWTPLHFACKSRIPTNSGRETIRLLLDKGADTLAETSRGWLPRHVAAWNTDPEASAARFETIELLSQSIPEEWTPSGSHGGRTLRGIPTVAGPNTYHNCNGCLCTIFGSYLFVCVDCHGFHLCHECKALGRETHDNQDHHRLVRRNVGEGLRWRRRFARRTKMWVLIHGPRNVVPEDEAFQKWNSCADGTATGDEHNRLGWWGADGWRPFGESDDSDSEVNGDDDNDDDDDGHGRHGRASRMRRRRWTEVPPLPPPPRRAWRSRLSASSSSPTISDDSSSDGSESIPWPSSSSSGSTHLSQARTVFEGSSSLGSGSGSGSALRSVTTSS